jgi:predicted ATP-grasp superfamily ATP-dependent carboligase
MTYVSSKNARRSLVTLVATMLIAGISGDAMAKAHKKHLHARSILSESHAQLVPQQPVQPGAMRYYGGPKSPMWRGPVEN